MWGHYSDGLRGFCIEFSGAANFLKGARLIHYKSPLPKAVDVYRDLLEACLLNNLYGIRDTRCKLATDSALEKIFCIKLEEWEYEHEWRISFPQPDSPMPLKIMSYKKTDVLSIILGAQMNEANKKLIEDIVRWKYGKKVKILTASVRNDGIIVE